MKTVMFANIVIMTIYAVCVTCAAVYFGNPKILWWYVMLGFIGFSYEKRLIDANARIDEIKKAHCTNCDNYNGIKCRACWVDDAIGLIDDAPTVDAVEVVHAYWTGSRFNPMNDEYEEYCSHCCAWSSEYGKPYCPNCGAKMDGGNEDGTTKD